MSTQIPIQSVDELPREKALKYEEVCQLVGDLILSSNQRVLTMTEQFNAVVAELNKQINALKQRNALLEQENGKLHESLVLRSNTNS